jgi:valyl-tRNA synthetase
LGDKIDTEAEIEKLNQELEYTRGFLKSVMVKLSNERFVANAKPEVVEVERRKMADAETKIKTIEEQISMLKK